jgi:hypothetical protein
VALGHRRLAIIDLTTSGNQPMVSASGRYCLVLNGEIYNHAGLRRELSSAGAQLRGESDTEVLLATIESRGLRSALEAAVGMFAFALWDRRTRTLTLARDHLGQKPLYFGRVGSTFAFASELKAFAAHPDFRPEVDRGALALFLRHQYVPAPHTIWRDVFKLPAGSLLSLNLDDDSLAEMDLLARIARHWCLRTVAERGQDAAAGFAEAAALDRLDQLLNQAVRDCMVADVPVGAFLSGGIDSSLVTALMQRHAARPVKTFTIGFFEAAFDEAGHAREVARVVAEKVEDIVINGDSLTWDGNTIYGLTNEPQRNSDTASNFGGGDWSNFDGTAANDTIVPTVAGMVDTLINDRHYGPFGVWAATTQFNEAHNNFYDDGSGDTPAERIMRLSGIESFNVADELDDGEVVVAQPTQDAIDLAGMNLRADDFLLQNVEWQSPHRPTAHFKVLAVRTARAKHEYNDRSAIAHATGA